MNATAITKFLAEQVMGWERRSIAGYAPDHHPNALVCYWDNETLIMKESTFDPFNKIEHAFMVEARMLFSGEGIHEKYVEWLASLFVDMEFGTDWDGWFHVIHASPKHRCLAAVRALATDAQLVEFGL